MKIIKHWNTLKRTRCNKCNCEFEYRQIDIKSSSYKYKGMQYIKRFLQCPECGEKIDQ